MPRVVLLVLAVLAAVQVALSFAGEDVQQRALLDLAVVPLRLTEFLDLGTAARVAASLPSPGDDSGLYRRAMAAYVADERDPALWTLLTYALLHAGPAHLILNGAWLLAFGSPVAARFGPARFLGLLAAGSIAGALAHVAADPSEALPMVGASAAISACAGAALRFAFGTRGGVPLAGTPARPLARALTDGRVLTFIGVWVALNAAAGAGFAPGAGEGAVAWAAHLGGFAAGFLGFGLFDPKPRG